MSAPPTATPAAPGQRDPAVHAATPAQLHWLEGELAQWQAEGLLAPEAAHAIRGRYVANRRFTLARAAPRSTSPGDGATGRAWTLMGPNLARWPARSAAFRRTQATVPGTAVRTALA